MLIRVDSWFFKIILVELNSFRGIFVTRGDWGLLPVVLHLFIFHSRQLLLRERTGKHSGLRFMSESSTRHISHGRCLSPERLNPALLSMLRTATFAPPFMVLNTSCLWVFPIMWKFWIKHKRRQTEVPKRIWLNYIWDKFDKWLGAQQNWVFGLL